MFSVWIFRPSAAVSGDGLLESCTCRRHCHGEPPWGDPGLEGEGPGGEGSQPRGGSWPGGVPSLEGSVLARGPAQRWGFRTRGGFWRLVVEMIFNFRFCMHSWKWEPLEKPTKKHWMIDDKCLIPQKQTPADPQILLTWNIYGQNKLMFEKKYGAFIVWNCVCIVWNNEHTQHKKRSGCVQRFMNGCAKWAAINWNS